MTHDGLAALLQRIEEGLNKRMDKFEEKLDRLDIDVKSDFIRRREIDLYVRMERYIWVERIVMGVAGLILVAALSAMGSVLWAVK
jgi:hypothetical protein